MTICDVTAIDRLLDFYGEYLKVKFENEVYELADLRDFLEDQNIAMSLDDCLVDRNGIYKNNEHIVSIVNLDSFGKDDLIKV
jgi:hypothetical protein